MLDPTEDNLPAPYGAMIIKVRQGKGAKDRLVPVQTELHISYQVITSWIQQDHFIKYSAKTMQRRYAEVFKIAKAAGIVPEDKAYASHVFRHSAARHWITQGVPINVISRWLGHADIQTTLLYLKLFPDPEGYMENVI